MKTADTLVESPKKYQNFIVFEPASSRISPSDILMRGEDVLNLYEKVDDILTEHQDDIKVQIILNRLQKIGNMLDLLTVYDNVIVTKFFNRIWKRYSYVSNLGESFIDLSSLGIYVPDLLVKGETLIADRIDLARDIDDLLDDDEDDDNDDENDENNNSQENDSEEES